ncbi:hypothetical protein [Rhodopirellula sp. P2]|uniref:hypothetical protein n=1 Tax=Rhodopirellula sp. P2 TaxID=2127060 RepID=UPI002368ABDA|nr:hypothetical protein [Rhodopirellula sp. P2]WDQ17522.1 hypothetical protein PSR62_02980 [Rhodopirellula sp. P2]
MYLLPCPHCEVPAAVSPARAGDRIACPHCGQEIAVPKLGELRQLPTAEGDETAEKSNARAAEGRANRPTVLFTALGLLAAGLFLAAAFCAVNWATIRIPMTTEAHIEEFHQAYQEVSSAQMIREWEEINRNGVDLPAMYQYRVMELDKWAWLRNAGLFSGAGLLAVIGAVFVGRSGRASGA